MSLFLKQAKFKSGKIYLSIVDGYWKDGKVKQKVYQKLGYLEDLKKQFDDPIVHYKNYVNELKKEFETKITTTFDLNKDNDFEDDTFNIGYSYLKKIFQGLNIIDVLKQNNILQTLNIPYLKLVNYLPILEY